MQLYKKVAIISISALIVAVFVPLSYNQVAYSSPCYEYNGNTYCLGDCSSQAHPSGTLVDMGDTKHTVSLIRRDGGAPRIGIPAASVFYSHGYNFDQVVPGNAVDIGLLTFTYSNLEEFQNGFANDIEELLTYADGTLVNLDGTIYMISNGQKRGFTSAEVFTGLGYSFKNSYIVAPEDHYKTTFANYPTGTPISSATEAHPDGALVKIENTIYQIQDGEIVGIPSIAVFKSHGFKWENVVDANWADRNLTALLETKVMKFKDGTLARDNSHFSLTIYFISGGKRRAFPTKESFENNGYQWKNVTVGNLSDYEDGENINTPPTCGS